MCLTVIVVTAFLYAGIPEPFFLEAYPTTVSSDGAVSIITGNVVNLRSAPSLDAAVVKKCSKGEPLITIGRSENTVRIGKIDRYWYRVRTQRGREGWIYGQYLQVLDGNARGDARLLRDLIHLEFYDKLFHSEYVFRNITLGMQRLGTRRFHTLTYEWEEGDIFASARSIYFNGAEGEAIRGVDPASRLHFFDFDNDEFVEIVALDTNRTSVSVYSEKQTEEIFRYSLYVDGPFDFLDVLGESRIEMTENRSGRSLEIVVTIREVENQPRKVLRYHWKNGNFRKAR